LPFLQAGTGVLGPAVLVLRCDAEPKIATGVSDPGLFMGAQLGNEQFAVGRKGPHRCPGKGRGGLAVMKHHGEHDDAVIPGGGCPPVKVFEGAAVELGQGVAVLR